MYTIDDLYAFCKENHYEKFSSTEKGAPLIVQSIGTFESGDNVVDGLKTVKLKSCHTGKNRNKSGISDDTMNLYKNSFMGRPILGAIYKTDTGEYEFRGHDMEIIEDGDDVDIKYIEQPVGVISQTVEPYLEYDEKMDKNYLMVDGTIFADYSKAAEILERRKTCKCSVEIAVEEMSYNCADDYLSIDKFHFCGVTILGFQQDGTTEIQEGMTGSKITIDDFSEKQNSMFSADCQSKLIATLDKLNNTLSKFNINNQEGGEKEMDNFENAIIEEENVTIETESTEETTEEETFASEDGDKTVTIEEESAETIVCESKKKRFSINEAGDMVVEFEISHEDVSYALMNLLSVYEEEDNEWYWPRSVFDNYFIFENWEGDKLYKQGYKIDGDSISFDGDRQIMFSMILTESEKLAIDKMREDYAALESQYNELKAFKEGFDAAQLKAQKDEIFAKVEYADLIDTDEFKALVADAEKYSVDEISIKCDLLFAAHVKATGTFAAKEPEPKRLKTMGFNFKATDDDDKPDAYGGLFNDFKKKNKKK